MLQQQKDIIQIPKNPDPNGKDFIIGDVHGSSTAFLAVLAILSPQDRLFIVGDLCDRGEDSLAIIQSILANQNSPVGPKIYVTRGNHEQLFFNALPYFLFSSITPQTDTDTDRALFNFLIRGGEWIFTEQNIRRLIKKFVKNNKPLLYGYDNQRIQNLWLQLKATCNIETKRYDENFLVDKQLFQKYREYIGLLPRIIDVIDKENGFLLCHADMPFDDQTLACRIARQDQLTIQEQDYTMWARPSEIAGNPFKRHPASKLCCVGHNVLNDTSRSPINAVRSETNTVNLDGAACRDNYFLVVNQTDRTVHIIGKSNEPIPEILKKEAAHIEKHISLATQQTLRRDYEQPKLTQLKNNNTRGIQQCEKLIATWKEDILQPLEKIHATRLPTKAIVSENQSNTLTITLPQAMRGKFKLSSPLEFYETGSKPVKITLQEHSEPTNNEVMITYQEGETRVSDPDFKRLFPKNKQLTFLLETCQKLEPTTQIVNKLKAANEATSLKKVVATTKEASEIFKVNEKTYEKERDPDAHNSLLELAHFFAPFTGFLSYAVYASYNYWATGSFTLFPPPRSFSHMAELFKENELIHKSQKTIRINSVP